MTAPCSSDGALLILTTKLAAVRIDADAYTATVDAGASWQQVIDAAAPFGLAPLAAASTEVSAAASTLGGGFSPFLGRRHGYPADHVRWIEIVTADGRLRRVDTTTDPDLFWALRGGGGGFGVITRMAIDLFPATTLYGGGLYFDTMDTLQVLTAWRDLARSAPDTLSTSAALVQVPLTREVPAWIAGTRVVHIRFAFLGSAADAERHIAPLREVAPLLYEAFEEMPFTAARTIHAYPQDPEALHDGSAPIQDLNDDALYVLAALAGGDDYPVTMVELHRLGGALGQPPRLANAVSYRDAAYLLHTVSTASPESATEVRNQQAFLLGAMSPWSSTVMDPDAAPAPNSPLASQGNLDRRTLAQLRHVKERIDPRDIFRGVHRPL